jgi:hypothetical protein
MYRSLIVGSLLCLCPGFAQADPVGVNSRTVPSVLQIYTPSLKVDDVTYSFETAFTMDKGPQGTPILQVGVTITKTSDGVAARWRDICVKVSPDATQLEVSADGRRFVLEAKYMESPPIDGAPPREVVTSFGQMFIGGKIGLVPRTES